MDASLQQVLVDVYTRGLRSWSDAKRWLQLPGAGYRGDPWADAMGRRWLHASMLFGGASWTCCITVTSVYAGASLVKGRDLGGHTPARGGSTCSCRYDPSAPTRMHRMRGVVRGDRRQIVWPARLVKYSQRPQNCERRDFALLWACAGSSKAAAERVAAAVGVDEWWAGTAVTSL